MHNLIFGLLQQYSTVKDKQLMLHVLIMERDPEASGYIQVFDGGLGGKLMHQFDVNNGSFPMSMTTTTNEIGMVFKYNVPRRPSGDPTKRCKHMRGCVRFLFELTSNYGK